VAITGGIACGKTTAGRLFEQQGIAVCEADELAHAELGKGSSAYRETVAVFGPGMVGSGGEIDRERLGRAVFADPAARERLNRIVHPGVREAWRNWLEQEEAEGHAAAAVIVPLLYEAGMQEGWDAVVCVGTGPRQQRDRLAQRGLEPGAIQQRLAAQWPLKRKSALADVVIFNVFSLEILEEQVRETVRIIMEKSYARR
jgi:dephospho-CoA kinase